MSLCFKQNYTTFSVLKKLLNFFLSSMKSRYNEGHQRNFKLLKLVNFIIVNPINTIKLYKHYKINHFNAIILQSAF